MRKPSQSRDGHRDLRRFFTQRRKRSWPSEDLLQKEEPGLSTPELPDKPSTEPTGSVAMNRPLFRNPLYAAPPRIGDLVPEEDDNDDTDHNPERVYTEMSQYIGQINGNRQQVTDAEREKLLAMLTHKEIAWTPSDKLLENCLGLRLLRKLVEYTFRVDNGDEELSAMDMERWLLSPALQEGVLAVTRLLQMGGQPAFSETTALEVCWEMLMLIEPILKAEPLITLDAKMSSTLARFERQLLAYRLWQGDLIYTLLHRQDQQPRRRSRCNSISSPGKALRSMTRSIATGVTPIEFFFRKFLRMAAAIFEYTISELQLDATIRQATWNLFMSGMEAEEDRRLMYHRNVLTLVACTIYSVAKLFDKDKSFAEIISCLHRKFPEYGTAWFQHVFLDEAEGSRDIVAFYNGPYLGAMRASIYALRPGHSSTSSTPEKGASAGAILTATPFPTVMGRVALARNVVLQVSSRALRTTETPPGTPTCITILGSLGARREQSIINPDPDLSPLCQSRPGRPRKVARRLDF